MERNHCLRYEIKSLRSTLSVFCSSKHSCQIGFVITFFNLQSTLAGFINVILREIQDNLPSLLDSALRMLLQLLAHWKTAISAGPGDEASQHSRN